MMMMSMFFIVINCVQRRHANILYLDDERKLLIP